MADIAPPPTAPRRLRRSTEDRDLAGVLGGLAEALGVESSWLRLAVVAATAFLAFGVGPGAQLLVVLPYAAAWALLPTRDAPALLAQVPRREAVRELALIGLLVVVTTVVAAGPAIGLVVVLAGIGALLLRDRPAADLPPAPPPPPVPAAVDPTRVEPDPVPPRRSRPSPRPRREPALWPLAAGLVAVIGVSAGAALVAGWVVDVRLVVNLLLADLGAVMVLSAWRGRARVLLLACPVLLPLWFATSAADIGGQEGAGRRLSRPATTAADDGLSYELGYGRLEVDLTDLELDSGTRTRVEVAVSVGAAQVTVPDGARVEVEGEVGLGVVGVPTDRWENDTFLAAHRDLDVRHAALGPACELSLLPARDLHDLATSAGVALPPSAPQTAGADVLDAIEDAGFPRPRVVGRDEWHDGPTLVVEDRVEAHVSAEWSLCTPVPPDPDPPVVVIDATIGLGTLEIRRA